MYVIDRDKEFSKFKNWLLEWENDLDTDQFKSTLYAFMECLDLTDEIRQNKGDINEVYRVWKLNCWDGNYQFKLDKFFKAKVEEEGQDWVFANMTTLWASILLNNSNKKYIVKKFLKHPDSYINRIIIPELEKIPVPKKEIKLIVKEMV